MYVWAIWDCSRAIKQTKEALSEDSVNEIGVPRMISTYACPLGQTLPMDSQFALDLSSQMRMVLKQNQGQLKLKEMLTETT